jgi:hypothetical protein
MSVKTSSVIGSAGSAALVALLLCVTGACSSTGQSDDVALTDDGGGTDATLVTTDGSTKDAGKDAGPAACGRNTVKCADGGKCAGPPDCAGGICRNNVCASPSPADGIQDGDETDVDCGGTKAVACADGKKCKVGADCVDGVCNGALVCAAPTCMDGVQNGAETAKDCGGGTCPVCNDGSGCKVGQQDCKSGVCSNNACTPSACSDKVKNGDETDVDCGGSCPQKCAQGQICKANVDCNNLVCDVAGTKKCLAPTAADGLQNGTETDVDCGGGAPTNAPRCAVAKKCLAPGDCASDGCDYLNKCALAPSCSQHWGGDTCGAGETGSGAAGGESHESCCASLPLLGSATRIDKYEITAGRMREFLRRTGNDVNTWYQAWKAANPAKVAGVGIAAGSEQYLPTGLATPDVPAFKWNYATFNPVTHGITITQTTDHSFGVYDHLGNTVFFADSPSDFQGCYVGPNETQDGHPTYWWDDVTQAGLWGAGPRAFTQQQLDEKSLNCVTQLLLAAFCAWDGGRLPTFTELASASANSAWGAGTYPWGNSPSYTDTWTTVVPGRVNPYADTALNGMPTVQGGVWDVLMPLNDGTGHANLLAPTYNTTNWNPFYPVIPSGLRYYWPEISTGNCGANDGTYSATCPGKAGQTCPTNCGWGQTDEAYEVAAPGRFTNDKRPNPNVVNPAAQDGWFDLTANIMEATSNQSGTDSANHDSLPTVPWVGGSFEGHGVSRSNFSFNILTKYGKMGGRCAR